MSSLDQITEGIEPKLRDRIREAIRLVQIQAIGSLCYRKDARHWSKPDSSPVSIADLLHQTQLHHLIQTRFAGDGLISEEPRDLIDQAFDEAKEVSRDIYDLELDGELGEIPETGDFTWVFDPIDGTKGYLAGRYYAIALGIFAEGQPIFGAMATPHRTEGSSMVIDGALAFAIAGKGAWIAKIGEGGDEKIDFQPLKSGEADKSGPLRVAVSLEHSKFGRSADEMGRVEIVRLDSQAKYLAVATGDIDLYIRARRDDGHPDVMWDHMPGGLIAREAGCAVTHFDKSEMEFAPQDVITFRGGVICRRGESLEPFGDILDVLTGSS